mmetsp:Transcript_36288/g.102220  ORF Transcript_36288/g.102220 Transcript_36288/m.102220 type:complete len:210 (+) Transcript_36288:879-1508(+)
MWPTAVSQLDAASLHSGWSSSLSSSRCTACQSACHFICCISDFHSSSRCSARHSISRLSAFHCICWQRSSSRRWSSASRADCRSCSKRARSAWTQRWWSRVSFRHAARSSLSCLSRVAFTLSWSSSACLRCSSSALRARSLSSARTRSTSLARARSASLACCSSSSLVFAACFSMACSACLWASRVWASASRRRRNSAASSCCALSLPS